MWGSYLHSEPWKATKKKIISNISLRTCGTCCERIMANSDEQGQQMRLCCREGSRAWSMASRGVCRADFLGWPRHTLILLSDWSSWWNSGHALNDLGVLEASMQTGPHSQAAMASSSVSRDPQSLGKVISGDRMRPLVNSVTAEKTSEQEWSQKEDHFTWSRDIATDSLSRGNVLGAAPICSLVCSLCIESRCHVTLGRAETRTYTVLSLWMLEEHELVKLYTAAAQSGSLQRP